MAASQRVGFLRTLFPAAAAAFFGAGTGSFAAETLNKREPALTAEEIKNAIAEAMKDGIPAIQKAVKEATGKAMEEALGEEFEKAMIDAFKKALREDRDERENGVGVNDAVEKGDENVAKDGLVFCGDGSQSGVRTIPCDSTESSSIMNFKKSPSDYGIPGRDAVNVFMLIH
ncbi:hypothetical protein POM88_040035 [Heracleum sosnowskyi]|uniref:Uncharacterized protein n=1 Tax=Heracleum sosnowskyi TaxID=360622 RepID=A0AAD8M9E3_9APIA|nr:hypothetical protein POM88_040035 [Heracleum sosnowskyi]